MDKTLLTGAIQTNIPEQVYSVQGITNLVLMRTAPPTLYMRAVGLARTTGFTQVTLEPRIYTTPPLDGIQEFDLVAHAPAGISLPVLTPVSAEVEMLLPDWAKGVRITAASNDVEQLFPVPLEAMTETSFTEDDKAAFNFLATDGTAADYDSLLIEEFEESSFTVLRSGQECDEFLLASVPFPETKTEWEVRCVLKDPFSGKCVVKTKVPIVYTRTSKTRLIARICYPSGKAVEAHLKDCVTQAIVAGVAVGVVTSGNLAAAAAALKSYLITCLKVKVGEAIDDLSVDIRREKITGEWKKL